MKTSKTIFFILLLLMFAISCQEDGILIPDSDFQLENRSAFPETIALPDGYQPEGIVVGKGHDAYVGSIGSGTILKVDLKTGENEVLVAPSGIPVVGLSFDARSNLVFAARGFAGVVSVYDSQTGLHVKDYMLITPGPIPTTWINDLVVTKKAVYATDSFRDVLYIIPLGPAGQLSEQSEVVEIQLTGDFQYVTTPSPVTGLFFNGNGIDATPNGKHLFLAHSDLGIMYHVDPITGECTFIDLGGEFLPSIDGILLDEYDGEFYVYAVQNFVNQITKIQLHNDLESGEVVEVITDPDFKIPTTTDEFGDGLYVVNARFDVASPVVPGDYSMIEFDLVRIDK